MAANLGTPPVEGDKSKAVSLNTIVWVCTTMTTLMYLGRMYTRSQITKNLGLDDLLISFSMVLLYTLGALASLSTHYGLGRHQYYLTLVELFKANEWQIISIPFGIFSSMLPKIAITISIIQILNPSRRAIVWLWTLNIVLAVASVLCATVHFVQCKPASAAWAPVGNYSCWNPSIVYNINTTQGAISAFTDFALALFPMPALWHLQMQLKRKLAVAGLMGLGVFTGVAALARTSIIASLNSSSDFTWSNTDATIFVSLEANITIICACLPTMRPLWRLWMGKKEKTALQRSEYTSHPSKSSSFMDRIFPKLKKSSRSVSLQ